EHEARVLQARAVRGQGIGQDGAAGRDGDRGHGTPRGRGSDGDQTTSCSAPIPKGSSRRARSTPGMFMRSDDAMVLQIPLLAPRAAMYGIDEIRVAIPTAPVPLVLGGLSG